MGRVEVKSKYKIINLSIPSSYYYQFPSKFSVNGVLSVTTSLD